MLLIIINYFVKFLTIIIGLIFLTGVFLPSEVTGQPMVRVLGAVLVVWGIYRIIIYRIQLKRYKGNDDVESHS